MKTIEETFEIRDKFEEILNLDISTSYNEEINSLLERYDTKASEIRNYIDNTASNVGYNFIELIWKKHLEIVSIIEDLIISADKIEHYKFSTSLNNFLKLRQVLIFFFIAHRGIELVAKENPKKLYTKLFIKTIIDQFEKLLNRYKSVDKKSIEQEHINYISFVFTLVNYILASKIKKLKKKTKGFDKQNSKSLVAEEKLKDLNQIQSQLNSVFYEYINTFRINKNNDVKVSVGGIEWKAYEYLSETIGESSWCRLSYLDGVLELMSPGKSHEKIYRHLDILIIAYCDEKEIDYYPAGSTTIKKQKVEVGKEPDSSYCFGKDRGLPDLAIEVNFTSGSKEDLKKYLLLNTKEIWMWNQKEGLTFYILENSEYKIKPKSSFLQGLSSETLQKYLNLMSDGNSRTIKKEFINEIKLESRLP